MQLARVDGRMILHVLIVDDEEDVLESLVPGFVMDLARRLREDEKFCKANESAGHPVPSSGRINIKLSAVGYRSAKVAKYVYRSPVHIHVHLCCEKSGSFPHALRLLREQFFAVVVSDLRFSDDMAGSRAGRFFIEDVHRRNPETFCILYSAYQRPDGFPDDRFIRKGAHSNLNGEDLLEKMVEGFIHCLSSPNMRTLAQELGRRGLVYESDAFGAVLRRLYDFAHLYFGTEPTENPTRRRPRPMILIDGETGTGKTELASLIHAISGRSASPFVPATCNQLTDENFLRSILFGHIKGSFSGAHSDRPGLVQTAGSGVLLLDDLHKLTDGCSMILHSFLDDGEYSHLGEDELRRSAGVAIVATVETPRWEEIKAEKILSESFLNRVEQLVLRVPPLRSRPEDIECQAQHYCAAHAEEIAHEMELSPEAITWLIDYGFPGGNSRRLRDFLRGAITSHARVTDYLDVAELQEYASEIGLFGGREHVSAKQLSTPTGGDAKPETPSGTESSAWPPSGEQSVWEARVVNLAVKALVDEYEIESDRALEICQQLFESDFPSLWESFGNIARRPDAGQLMEIKLFDELFRYFAIYQQGSPVKAAKELGMKDNALREFVYSREQKRTVATEKS